MAGAVHSPAATPAGRLDTQLLLRAYAAGLFPMADTREASDIFWVEPRQRGILPLQGFHLSRSLARTLQRETFLHSCDLAFSAVIRSCAARSMARQQSWINLPILDAYIRLHRQGHAHSVETWDRDGRLAGGLYGVRIGGAFFGESMFSRQSDASKAALAHLVARLRLGGFQLLDTQFLTSHLASFGGVEVRRQEYLERLRPAVTGDGDWLALERRIGLDPSVQGRLPLPDVVVEGSLELGDMPDVRADPAALSGFGPSGAEIVQLLSQTS